MDLQEKEESEQQREETPEGAWCLGSMNALTREPRTRWTQPMPQKRATNRFAVLAEPDTHGTVNAASHAASEVQKKTTVRSTKIGSEEERKLEPGPRMVLVHSRPASPILDEGSGEQIGVRSCQGYSQSRIPIGGGCGRLRS